MANENLRLPAPDMQPGHGNADPVEAARRRSGDATILGAGGVNPDTEEFRRRYATAAAAIDQMVRNLEDFGADPESVRLIEFEHETDGRIAYQAVATMEAGAHVLKERNEDHLYGSPVEALHKLSLWLKELIDSGRVKLPTQITPEQVLYDAAGNPLHPGLPDT